MERGCCGPPDLDSGASSWFRAIPKGCYCVKSVLHVVCLLTPDNRFGGPTSVAADLCVELQERGVDVALGAMASGWTRIPSHHRRIPLISGPARRVCFAQRVSLMFSVAGCLRILRASRRYELIHVHLGRDLFTALTAFVMAIMRRPIVVQTHGMVPPKGNWAFRLYDRILIVPTVRRARRVLYLTDHEYRQLRKQFPQVEERRFARLTNGVAVSSEAEIVPRQDRKSTVFAARLHDRKRPTAFVRAAASLLASETSDMLDTLTFDLIGPDEGELRAVREAIPGWLSERIRYLGPYRREALGQALAEALVLVLPSVDEPYPVTVLEALAVGTPVVCTESCGLANELRRANAGIVVAPLDVEIRDAIARLLLDTQFWQTCSENALDLAKRMFDIRGVASRLAGLYDDPSGSEDGAASHGWVG